MPISCQKFKPTQFISNSTHQQAVVLGCSILAVYQFLQRTMLLPCIACLDAEDTVFIKYFSLLREPLQVHRDGQIQRFLVKTLMCPLG